MENDPFYSDYDNDAFYCWKFEGCEITIDSDTSTIAEIKVPIGHSNIVQKYIDFINNDEMEVNASFHLVETQKDKELWEVKADKDIIGLTMEFYDFHMWK